jgi:acetylornithine/succinyldiaminopimelate/putrescine aminotransferase
MSYNEKEECVEFQNPEYVLKFVIDKVKEAVTAGRKSRHSTLEIFTAIKKAYYDNSQLCGDQLWLKLAKAIRNQGLMMALEFESFDVLKPIIDRAIALGVITDWFLFCDDSMRIAPPLTITPEQIQEACALILQAIDGD